MQTCHSILGLSAATLLGSFVSPPAAPPVPPAAVAPAPAAAPRSGASAASERLLRAIPEDAMAFAAAWDIDAMRERGEKSAWWRFCRDEQIQTFFDAIWDGFRAAVREESGAPEPPFAPTDLWEALHGSVAGFVRLDIPNESVAAGLLIETGEEREGLEEIFDTVVAMVEKELESSAESYGGAELRRMSGIEGDGEDGEITFLDHPELMGFVISDEADLVLDTVHGIVDRFTGADAGAGFSASQSLREARATGGARRDTELMCDVGPVIAAVLDEEEPDDAERKLLDRIGVTSLRWFYWSSSLGTDEKAEMTFSGYVPPNTYFAEAAQLLGPAPVEMLKLVPAGTEQVQVARFDLHGLYQLVMRAIQEHDQEAHQQVTGLVQMAGATGGIDLEKDILAQITGDFASFIIPSTEEVPIGEAMVTGMTPGGAMLIGIEDTEEFELFLDDLFTMVQLDAMIETQEFMGREIRELDLGGPSAYFAFTDGAFVYAGGLEPIHAVLRLSSAEEGRSAFDDPELQKLARSGVLSLSRADTASSLAMQIDVFSGLNEMAAMAGMDGDDDPFAYLPWPDGALAEKYFDGELFSTVVREGNALVMRAWSE